MFSRVVVIFAAAFLFAGCATPPKDDPEALAEFEKANDPIEPFNRVVFDFNMFVDKLIFKPIATMYAGAMPEYGQERVHNVLANMRAPVVFINDVLQGEGERAGVTAGRFAINTTIGVGWSNVEFELLGQAFRNRGRRTDEMLEVMRKLWTGEFVEHHGEFYDFARLRMQPAPKRPIPVWVGGISDPALRRAARNDGWISDLQPTADIVESILKIRKWRAEAGLEGPFDVTASASDAADVPAYRLLEDAGVTHILTIPWAFYHGLTNDLEKQCDGICRFAKDVIRELS